MMLPTIPAIRPHTDALIAAMETNTGKPVGNATAPDEGAWTEAWGKGQFIPYLVIVNDNVKFTGPLGDPQADATLTYRVIAVGSTRRQAEWMSDKGRAAFTRANIEAVGIPNRRVMGATWTGKSQTQRDSGVKPPLYYVRDTYTLMTTVGA